MRANLTPETLLGAALAGRAPRSEAPSRREGEAGFAGLLDGARLQQGRSEVYDGSAFDVPEASSTATAPQAASAAEIERRQIDQRQQWARDAARRDSSEPPESDGRSAPRASEAKAAANNSKPRAPDATRESGRAPKEPAIEDETAAQPASAARQGSATVAQAAEGEPGAASASTTQEWMARWASLSGVAAQTGAAPGEEAVPAQPRSRMGGPGGMGAGSAATESGTAPVVSAEPALRDVAAGLAGESTASFEDARERASSALAPISAARIEAAIPAPGAQAAAPGTAPSTAAQTPTATTVPVPLDAPDFSQALGWQLATLARDGVHEAQLQLNPVEMGPVQVQILLDGGQAQIDFTAVQQRTREVLEAGWPALAAAMHSAGFTLGGGGVFEQREQAGQGQGNGARSRSGRDDTAAVAEPGVTRLASTGARGLLDLYA